jgi:hypothetical protein
MNINLNNFWGNNSYNNPPINPDEISRLEIESGFTLPNLYKDLLLIQNGGYVNKTKFPTTITNSWSEDHTIFNYMFGIILDPTHKSAFNLCDNSCFINEWGYPNNVLGACLVKSSVVPLNHRSHNEKPLFSEIASLRACFPGYFTVLERGFNRD